MFKLIVFVPCAHAPRVMDALFAAGAGRQGSYDRCAWSTEGVGQFRPSTGSTPYIGTIGAVERVRETRIEMLCADEHVIAAVDALLAAHPYEEPAYEAIRVLQRTDLTDMQ